MDNRLVIKSDCHMHTVFSTDSDALPEKMAEGAISKGLESICFTDHYDLGFPYYAELGKDAFLFDIDAYFTKMKEIQQRYADRLCVRIGIELGLQPHLSDRLRQVAETYPFDFVIGSVHLVEGKDPYYREDFGEIEDEVLYRKAFEATLKNVQETDSFDVLGHLDYVVRYGREQGAHYSYRKYADVLDEILRTLIDKGKGLEVNTAGYKYGLGFPNPHPDVLRRYKELGGEIITIGADAHQPLHIGWEFEKAAAVLESCGFRYYTEFTARKPEMRSIRISGAAREEVR